MIKYFSSIYFFFAIVASLTAGCKNQPETEVADTFNRVTVPPADTISFGRMKEVNLDSFFHTCVEKTAYINLQQNDSSFILVNKIIYRAGKIYILDQRKAVIAVYDSTGALQHIFSGKNDYARIADFEVDQQENLYLLDGKNERLLCYSPSYNLLYKKNLPFETDILYPMSNGNFLLSLSSWNSRYNKGEKLIQTDSLLHVKKKYLKYNDEVDHTYWIKGYRFLPAAGKIYFNRPIENSVYILSPAGDLIEVYYFDFGDMNVPGEDKKNIEANLPKYSHYRLLTDFTFINDQFALGKIWDKRRFRFFYLDRASNTLYLEDPNRSSPLKYIGDFNGRQLVSIIYPGEFNEKDYASLPTQQKQWLLQGGYVLCRFWIK
ncbi:MAG: 6-bladed beta-propeller [Chitinophagaceae bacterium]|nr:6-bladed beta-propeller [Chitinophagaceae bacterium]